MKKVGTMQCCGHDIYLDTESDVAVQIFAETLDEIIKEKARTVLGKELKTNTVYEENAEIASVRTDLRERIGRLSNRIERQR